ncbi:MAG: hypothetical protein HZC42_02445 [Candidatus Eisenbacteria bacterium]|nr:hypothetical protein [Candidatus Eisenbacteria bacterium]
MRRLLAVLALLAAAAACWWLWPADPVGELRHRWSPLARVERISAPQLGERIERWRLTASDGSRATGLWRAAPPGTARPWTVVLLGGLVTGDRAALLLPADAPVHVLAMDWPWEGSRRMPVLRMLRELGAIRHAALRSPAVLALGVAAAARQPEADPERVALVGASLGVPPAVAALRLTPVPRALVLIDGGAGLSAMFRHLLERARWPALFAAPLGALAARLVRPLEPALHAEATRRVRVLVINGDRDEMLPPGAIRRLHASCPGAEVRWRHDTHLRPRRLDVIAATAREAGEWLKRGAAGR